MEWKDLLLSDIASINSLVKFVRSGFPERIEVLEEKIKLYPYGCQKLVSNGNIVGYATAYPWMFGAAPRIDEFLCAIPSTIKYSLELDILQQIAMIPSSATSMHIHDIVLPEMIDTVTKNYIDYIKTLAITAGILKITTIVMHNFKPMLTEFGFYEQTHSLFNYANDHTYMVCDVEAQTFAEKCNDKPKSN